MTELNRMLVVKAYVTPDNVPTCAAHFPTGKVCQFLQLTKMGTTEICGCNNKFIERANHCDDMGYLVPHDDCPVWNGKVADDVVAI